MNSPPTLIRQNNVETMEIFELPLAYRILYYHHGRLEIKYVLRSLNILLFHFTLRLSINSIIGFLFPKVWHLDNFERPVDIHNHASWYVCKVTLWACKDYKHCLWSNTTHNKCYSRDELYSVALSWNWAWSIGIMTSKVFILESTAGPMNIAHKLSIVMDKVPKSQSYSCYL